jgi:hypothetical protein
MLRTGVLCCAVAGALGLVVGCNQSSDNKSSTAKKDEAVAAFKVKIDEMDKKLAELKEKAEKAVGEDKVKLEAKWHESAGKREAAMKKLDELKAAAADKWEVVKKDAESAFDALKKAVE